MEKFIAWLEKNLMPIANKLAKQRKIIQRQMVCNYISMPVYPICNILHQSTNSTLWHPLLVAENIKWLCTQMRATLLMIFSR